MGLVFTFGHFPIGVDALIAESRKNASQRSPELCNDRVTRIVIFQLGEEGTVVETRVGSDADLANVGGRVVPAMAEKIHRAAVRVRLSGTKRGSQQVSRAGFHAEQGLIGSLA